MNCLNCGYANAADAKFCQNCGKPLEQKCQNCGTANALDARFCKSCGFRLGQSEAEKAASTTGDSRVSLSADHARLARLAASAPAPLAAKMRAAASLAGERRVVTCLFADVVSSTSLAEQLDPEDLTALMNQAFDQMTAAVYRYEGTIARLMGDAILAFFGAPVAHEDDPLRAVRASLDLVAAARKYAEEVRLGFGVDFALRVGLNTGPVVVGEVGTNLVYEYTAMGDAINLAARMQAAARPMGILITEHTYRFVAPFVERADLGLMAVKGKAEPVHAYEVLGLKETPDKARGLAGLESPLVGRDAEQAVLLQTAAAVRAGLGRVVIISGEAGLGKSRLVAEWKTQAMKNYPSMLWAEGHSLSYGQGLAYHLLVDLLRSLLGVSATSSEEDTRAGLAHMVEDLFPGAALDIYPYLGHLLSLQLEEPAMERVRQLDPQALQAQYLSALRQFLRKLAARQPLALILEDIHWADPSSTELLVRLLPLAAEAPVLFCFLTRPDRDTPGWKLIATARESIGAGLAEISLKSLSEADSRRLVANLLEIEALPESMRSLILKKAEGNPFFVEEVIRMLIERRAIVLNERGWVAAKEMGSVEIPDNLQGLLLARIDRLPEDVRQTLRVAAVIGRQFPVKVLEQVLKSVS